MDASAKFSEGGELARCAAQRGLFAPQDSGDEIFSKMAGLDSSVLE
ncbi:MAG TPA: hypothetical protein VHC69_34585 [Polyangiaceae bacterium]|nr:hypothetical protein [Polyangiaceae bacterium]